MENGRAIGGHMHMPYFIYIYLGMGSKGENIMITCTLGSWSYDTK